MITLDNILYGTIGLSSLVLAIQGVYSIHKEVKRLKAERKILEGADEIEVIKEYNLKTGEVKYHQIPVYHINPIIE